jgi:hypothetical protein
MWVKMCLESDLAVKEVDRSYCDRIKGIEKQQVIEWKCEMQSLQNTGLFDIVLFAVSALVRNGAETSGRNRRLRSRSIVLAEAFQRIFWDQSTTTCCESALSGQGALQGDGQRSRDEIATRARARGLRQEDGATIHGRESSALCSLGKSPGTKDSAIFPGA